MSRKDGHHKSHEQPQDQPPPAEQAPAPISAQGHPAELPAQPETAPPPELSPPEQLEAVTAERDDLLNRLQRLSADYVNYQKRAHREAAAIREYANEELIKSLLGVLDDIHRALEAGKANHPADDPLLVGLRLANDKALEVLGRHGLKPIEAVGRPFNPELHLAVAQEPTAEHPPLTVLRELQTGFMLKSRVIRPATVVVAQAPDQAQGRSVASQPAGPDH